MAFLNARGRKNPEFWGCRQPTKSMICFCNNPLIVCDHHAWLFEGEENAYGVFVQYWPLWSLFRFFGGFSQNFPPIQKPSRSFENFQEYVEIVQTYWKFSNHSLNFPHKFEMFDTVWKLFEHWRFFCLCWIDCVGALTRADIYQSWLCQQFVLSNPIFGW